MSEMAENYTWRGRDDTEDGEQGKRWHHIANATDSSNGLGLVGFMCDLGVAINKGRVGAPNGPNAIRNALANQAWHVKAGLYDAGNVIAQTELPVAQDVYADAVAQQLNQQSFVIGLGGGHEIAWGSYQGLLTSEGIQKHTRIGIINFDAHFDLRKPTPLASSGTPFRQIAEHCQQQRKKFNYCCLGIAKTANTQALFDYAEQTSTHYLLDHQCNLNNAINLLENFLTTVDEVYVTICLDALPAYVAPGVSAPSALGIQPKFVIEVLQWLGKRSQQSDFVWRLADIAEMNPDFDIDDRTAKIAARLVHEIVEAVL